MNSAYDWLRAEANPIGSATDIFQLGRELESREDLRMAATAYDRAYALEPDAPEIAAARRELLDRLSVEEYDIRFRYIPAGAFLMGSSDGDPDERPVHVVELGDYWMSETAVSWAAYCDLMGWNPPPDGSPRDWSQLSRDVAFHVDEERKIRLQYCEDATTRARDWHAHAPRHNWQNMGTGELTDSWEMFGRVRREDPRRPWQYDRKPVVGIAWQDAEAMCLRMSSDQILYCLPTEAEWERAARGALIDCLYPWGDDPPDRGLCDYDRFEEFSILPMRRLPPNGYGLFAMSGSVWEWTADWYDAEYYKSSPGKDPAGPSEGTQRVLRGGSWADCADTVTVSFRMSRDSSGMYDGIWGQHMSPNIGFRVCRKRLDMEE
jgi:formylglycine-generating enzyme required for sulfatase activity